jgi:hypothetical protein
MVGSIQYQIRSDTEAVVQSCGDFIKSLLPRNSVALGGHRVDVTHMHPTDSYTSLKSILIPHSVHTIFGAAFFSFDYFGLALESLVFGSGSEFHSILSAIFQKSSLNSLFVPQSVSFIRASAFAECQSVDSLLFGRNSSLMQLQDATFSSLERLSSIKIPASLRQISNLSFQYCINLRSVTFESPSQCRYIACGAFCHYVWLDSIFLPPSAKVQASLKPQL